MSKRVYSMKMEQSRPFSLLQLSTFVILALATSSINGETDKEYWKRRREEAEKFTNAAYVRDPFTVTDSFNAAVHKIMDKDTRNTTRRSLSPVLKRSCKATNPIDRCWRCQADWASNRTKLQGCVKGFGRHAAGGGPRAAIYVVTDSSDEDSVTPKFGTLRYGVIRDEPLWIIFQSSMTIALQKELLIAEHKTIDGRGARVEIAYGAGITIQNVDHVIIHGIHIHNIGHDDGGLIRDHTYHWGIRTRSDGDGIQIIKSANVWMDHLTMYDCEDGLIDAIDGSTAITISNSHFYKHDKAILLGAHDDHYWDDKMQVTLAFNRFGPRVTQRMPRVRYGFVHVVNNEYLEWGDYCIGGSKHPTIISQGNKFTPNLKRPQANEVTKREYKGSSPRDGASWNWTSDKDLLLYGARFVQSGLLNINEHTKKYKRSDVFTAKDGSFAPRLTRFAGALDCTVGEPC